MQPEIESIVKQMSKLEGELKKLRAARIKAEAKEAEKKKERAALEKELIRLMHQAKTDMWKVPKGATAELNKATVFNFKDPEPLFKFIYENKAYDILQRRVNNSAILDRIECGERVPGVEKFVKQSIKIILPKR